MALEKQFGSGNVAENVRSTGDWVMQSACLKMIYELAKKDARVVFIGTDNAPDLLSEMQAEMPDRFFMEGTWEANLVGLASGLSADGFVPFILNHATFITRRGYEQILLDSCLQKRPIVLIGSGRRCYCSSGADPYRNRRHGHNAHHTWNDSNCSV